MSFNRLTRDKYYSLIAETTSLRSNCIKRKVGCVIVKDDRIVSLGFNGTPRGTQNCFEGGCERCNDPNVKSGENLHFCKCIHAETNALLFSDFNILKNASIYITNCPCLECAKLIVQCGIKYVYYNQSYNPSSDNLIIQFLEKSDIICELL
jgi:dCMP deaminase